MNENELKDKIEASHNLQAALIAKMNEHQKAINEIKTVLLREQGKEIAFKELLKSSLGEEE